MKSILVPVDGSESASRAAGFAGKLAGPLTAKLILLHVYDAPAASLLGLASLGEAAVKDALNKVAELSFERALLAIELPNALTIEKFATTGHPSEEIIGHARASTCDLIVMGSRGLSPLQEIMLGSVSDRVLRFAPCAVTVVR
jgi:nucleotide-binding universal stress UspA family protein